MLQNRPSTRFVLIAHSDDSEALILVQMLKVSATFLQRNSAELARVMLPLRPPLPTPCIPGPPHMLMMASHVPEARILRMTPVTRVASDAEVDCLAALRIDVCNRIFFHWWPKDLLLPCPPLPSSRWMRRKHLALLWTRAKLTSSCAPTTQRFYAL